MQYGRELKFRKFYFEDIYNSGIDLNRFKRGCLNSRTPAFESSFLQVGILSNLFFDNNKNFLRMCIFIGNISGLPIYDLIATYMGTDGKKKEAILTI